MRLPKQKIGKGATKAHSQAAKPRTAKHKKSIVHIADQKQKAEKREKEVNTMDVSEAVDAPVPKKKVKDRSRTDYKRMTGNISARNGPRAV